MNWPMSLTTFGVNPPDVIDLPVEGGTERLVLAGPSMNGWIYRSENPMYWCRLLPREDVPIKRRSAIRLWVEHAPARGCAEIVQAQHLDDLDYYLIRYRVPGATHMLEDVLVQPDPLNKLGYILQVFRQMDTWQDTTGGPVLPMPADMILDTSGTLVLLALPFWQLPGIQAVFDQPERGLYLAPELIRGRVEGDERALDRYAAAVLLLRCFRKLPQNLDAAETLLRAATGDLVSTRLVESSLPFWMERIRTTQLALSIARSLLIPNPAARRAVPWEHLAQELESCRRGMHPIAAVREMWQASGADSAFSLLQDILLFEESYELLLLGGEIAGGDMNRPLAAIDLLERAIALEPQRQEAYLAHFKVVSGAEKSPTLAQVYERSPQAAAQLDETVERDVRILAAIWTDDLVERHADYLIWREQYEYAVNMIYPHLFENNEFAFWKFWLNLLYAEALMGHGLLDQAQAQLQIIRQGLTLVTQNQALPGDIIQEWGNRLDLLQRRLLILRNPSAFQAPPGKSIT